MRRVLAMLRILLGGWWGGAHSVFIGLCIVSAAIGTPESPDATKGLFLICCGLAIIRAFIYGVTKNIAARKTARALQQRENDT